MSAFNHKTEPATRTFSIPFESLGITPADLEKHIGYIPGSSLASFGEYYDDVLHISSVISQVCGGYRIFDQAVTDPASQGITAGGMKLFPGDIILEQLKDISGLAVFVCTAGHPLSELSTRLRHGEDMLRGYLLDICGSVIVEKALDVMQRHLSDHITDKGLTCTIRHSPGHCGWDVAAQQTLFELLPEKFCGLGLSDSSLMDPVKSQSGIIGLGPGIKKKGRPCTKCRLNQTCLYFQKKTAPLKHEAIN
jgi:hypothetical protein